MEAQRISTWVQAVGVKKAHNKTGISLSTLGRYATGETVPTGANAVVLKTLISAWEKAKNGAAK